MHMPLLITLLLLLADIGCATAAETGANTTLVTGRERLRLRLSAVDRNRVAAAALWVSRDHGRSWQRAQRLEHPPGSERLPVFEFVPPADGVYTFATVTEYRDGTAEAGPQPGTTRGQVVVIDRSQPHFDLARVDEVGEEEGRPLLRLRWQLREANLDSLLLEQRDASGTWQPAHAFDELRGERTVHAGHKPLRLRARDRAGNESIAALWRPPSDDAGTSLEELADALPELTEETDNADVDAGSGEQDTAAKASQANVSAPQDEARESPATAQRPTRRPLPPDHRDVIAPNAGETPAMPRQSSRARLLPVGEDRGDPALEPDIDRAYRQALQDDAPPDRYSGEIAEAQPRAQSTNRSRNDPAQVLAGLSRGILVGAEADTALAAARRATTAGDQAVALALLQRLRDSSRSAEALLAEARLLAELDRLDQALKLLDDAPPEAQSPAASCTRARLLLDAGRHAEAEQAVHAVPLSSKHSREARLLHARALRALGRRADALAILRDLARGDDVWGREAQRLLP